MNNYGKFRSKLYLLIQWMFVRAVHNDRKSRPVFSVTAHIWFPWTLSSLANIQINAVLSGYKITKHSSKLGFDRIRAWASRNNIVVSGNIQCSSASSESARGIVSTDDVRPNVERLVFWGGLTVRNAVNAIWPGSALSKTVLEAFWHHLRFLKKAFNIESLLKCMLGDGADLHEFPTSFGRCKSTTP